MRVLVLNPGSSSLKVSVIEEGRTVSVHDTEHPVTGADALAALVDRLPGADAAGVRVVHGGPRFTRATVVDLSVRRELAALVHLAPLHQPPAVAVLDALARSRPDLPVVACFDTAFHAGLPAAAATYAVPWSWTVELGIRRYGFHGLSHRYASRRAAVMVGRPVESLRTVTCHLGSGCSLAAVHGGASVDTTMGFTPVEGLVMATRSGSVDPGALLWLLRGGHCSVDELDDALETGSGLLAVSGVEDGDMRTVLERASRGDARAALALDVYVHRLAAGVAAMAAAMDGLDVLVFTGGVGEHAAVVRERACARLGFLGVRLAAGPGRAPGGTGGPPDGAVDADVSAPGAAVRTLVVHAREDLEIAGEVVEALGTGGPGG